MNFLSKIWGYSICYVSLPEAKTYRCIWSSQTVIWTDVLPIVQRKYHAVVQGLGIFPAVDVMRVSMIEGLVVLPVSTQIIWEVKHFEISDLNHSV